MATTTPNYGWDVPTSTDYVKDGATAIETLGDDIDASLYTITSGKNVGLVPLINTTFTAQSAIQVDNVFTTNFDCYKIIFSLASMSGSDVPIRMRFVDGTTPVTSANFYFAGPGVRADNGAAVATHGSGATSAIVAYGNSTATAITAINLDVLNPNLARLTNFTFNSFSNSGILFSYAGGGSFDSSTQFEGIQFFPNSGTFGGNIKIYGYRNP
jgi:hypothetical protein